MRRLSLSTCNLVHPPLVLEEGSLQQHCSLRKLIIVPHVYLSLHFRAATHPKRCEHLPRDRKEYGNVRSNDLARLNRPNADARHGGLDRSERERDKRTQAAVAELALDKEAVELF